MRQAIDILKVLIQKEIIVKYKGTYLGYLWSLAHPLMLTVVFFIAFKIVVKIPIENYTLFLISGLFAWQWFSNSVTTGVWSFVFNAPLIKKTTFKKFLLPLSLSIVDMFHFLIALVVIIMALAYYDMKFFYVGWLYQIPVMLFLQLTFSFSFGLIAGSLQVMFRDIDRVVMLVLTLLMYLTPVFYSIDMIPQKYQVFFYLNPLTSIIESWRNIFFNGELPLKQFSITLIEVAVFFMLSWKIYKTYEWKFAENL